MTWNNPAALSAALRMRYGVYVPSYGPYGDPATLRELAVAAEEAGWDGFFMWDLVTPDTYEPPFADPWVVLAAIAQATTSIRLGPLVTPLPRRRLGTLALQASTLQALSGGRLTLGLGTGVDWDYSRWGEPAKRSVLAARLDEGTPVLRRLLSGEPVDHEGDHYRVSDVRFPPSTVPLWTSGFWPRKGPVRGAAGADGLFPQIRDSADDFRIPTPAELITIRADFERAGGRPGADIVIWSPNAAWAPDAETAKAYQDVGVTWWLQDGSEVTPDALLRRLAEGPPQR